MYRYFGFEFSDELRQKMQTYLDNRPRDKHGKHEYSAGDYGLDPERDGEQFSAYMKRYLPERSPHPDPLPEGEGAH